MNFTKILIANRGECSLRIQQTLRKMGFMSVAVFSDADRASEHVRCADEAYRIGPGPSSQSYLQEEIIIEVAKNSGCKAIHPGYGFLAENADFARKVIDAGLIWIGPKPELIDLFGDKVKARKLMQNFSIPLLPGTVDSVENVEEVMDIVRETGFPLIIKAAGGGGGKGMRVVRTMEDLDASLQICMSEAERSFGNSAVFIEKYVEKAHHIEFQVLGDKHGQAWHFGHRECSVQRRHQKVIEESPSPVISEKSTDKLLNSLVNLCKEVGYDSLGTFEFLRTNDDHYYFLEMNTRLQVEHSVTEMTWDVDLVQLQIESAFGNSLSLDHKKSSGAAIECRIYAEDPLHNFAPSPGKVDYVEFPQDPQLRVDSYLRSGLDVPVHYDPMVAKLTVWGSNRNAARLKMIEVLSKSSLRGFANNLAFHDFIMRNSEFGDGAIHTNYLSDNWGVLTKKLSLERQRFLYLAAAVGRMRLGWHSTHADIGFRITDKQSEDQLIHLKVALIQDSSGCNLVVNDDEADSRAELVILDSQSSGMLILHRGHPYFIDIIQNANTFGLNVGPWSFELEFFEPGSLPISLLGGSSKLAENVVLSPINGKVLRVLREKGQIVQEGDILIILEAMKMENEIRAPMNGVVDNIVSTLGSSVEKGQLLFEIRCDDQNNENV